MDEKKLMRKEEEAIIGGVCAGIGEYFSVDKTLVRLLFALAAIFWGSGLLAYVVSWVLIPAKKR